MSQITITQAANQLNLANADLIWEVTSSQYQKPQFQYICSLQDGCGKPLTTIKQQPNPSGFGVFDLGRLVKQYLGYDTRESLFKGGVDGFFQLNSETAKFFRVAFGEEYATSTTSSVTYYSGVGNATGSAAFTGSTPYYYFINGVIDPNYGQWNWNTSSFYQPRPAPNSQSFSANVCLTDAPRTQYARSTDYMTISALNGNINGVRSSSQDIYAADIDIYNNAGAVIGSITNFNFGTGSMTQGGPRQTPATLWTSAFTVDTCSSGSFINKQTSGSLLIHIPIGPQNITNYGNFDLNTLPWERYVVKLHPQQAANTPNVNATWDTFTIVKSTGNCAYNGVRFAFVNDYGVWDYYTFSLADANTYEIDRGIYKQNFVDYSTGTTSVPYNIARRGNNSYYTNINQTFTANSDWLIQDEADWLQQLFYSPNVYIQDGFDMVPVIITTSTLNAKTNPRTQKLFNYQITYTLANNKRSR